MVAYNQRAPDEILDHVRRALGATPRRFSWWDRLTYLRIKQPVWAKTDALKRFFAEAPRLLADGFVTWGHVVQANSLLFSAGPNNCPGEVLYSGDPRSVLHPEELEPIARALFALKGTKPEAPGEREIADYLTNELIRVFGLSVPTSISGDSDCQISTVFFDRKHLPDQKLSRSYFPILVSPRNDGMAMLVPSRYWPENFSAHWTR